MVINKLAVNGHKVDHFFDGFGKETFKIGDAVEYGIGDRLFQISASDDVVIDIEPEKS